MHKVAAYVVRQGVAAYVVYDIGCNVCAQALEDTVRLRHVGQTARTRALSWDEPANAERLAALIVHEES